MRLSARLLLMVAFLLSLSGQASAAACWVVVDGSRPSLAYSAASPDQCSGYLVLDKAEYLAFQAMQLQYANPFDLTTALAGTAFAFTTTLFFYGIGAGAGAVLQKIRKPALR